MGGPVHKEPAREGDESEREEIEEASQGDLAAQHNHDVLVGSMPTPDEGVGAAPDEVDALEEGAQALTELTAILDGKKSGGARVVVLCAKLPTHLRAQVAATRLADLRARTSGAQFLAAADLCDIQASVKIAMALDGTKPPSATELQPHMWALEEPELQALCDDAAALARVRALLPGPASQYMPAMRHFWDAATITAPRLRWFVESHASTPLLIALALLRSDDKAAIAKVLDAENLWGWIDALQPTDIPPTLQFQLEVLALEAKDPAAKATLTTLAANAPKATSYEGTEVEQGQKQKAGAADLDQQLESDAASAETILEASGRAQSEGAATVGEAAHRKRGAAELSAEQVLTLSENTKMSVAEAIDWLAEAGGAGPAHVAMLFEMHGLSNQAGAVIGDAKRLCRLKKILGSAPLLSVISERNDELHAAVLGSSAARGWVASSKQPIHLLWLATGGKTGDSTAAACKWMASSGIGFGWVQQLDEGSDSLPLRLLALNCPDDKAVAHIRNFLLHDTEHAAIHEEGDEADPSASRYRSALTEVENTVDRRGDTSGVADLSGAMTGAELATLRKDEARLTKLFAKLDASDAVRVASQLDLPLDELLPKLPATNGRMPFLVTYVRSRDHAEQLAVASDPELGRMAQQFLELDPLRTVPVLRQPASLASALEENPALIGWILEASPPIEALKALGHPTVAKAAGEALWDETEAVAKLPAGDALPESAREALKRLLRHTTDEDVKETLEETRDEVSDPEIPEDANDLAVLAARSMPLWDGIQSLIAKKIATPQNLLTLCSERATESGKLLGDPKHAETVTDLEVRVRLSPVTVFPELPWYAVMNVPASRSWLLDSEPSYVVLEALSTEPQALDKMGKLIDKRAPEVESWLDALPTAKGLNAVEERGLRKLLDEVTTVRSAKRLYEVRFGIPCDGDWSLEAIRSLWDIAHRLPDAQLEGGGVIQHMERVGGLSTWNDTTGTVKIGEEPGAKTTRYADAAWSSKADLAKLLDVGEPEIDRRVADGTVEEESQNGVSVYRIAPVKMGDFDETVLHEIGHAVDTMLGEHTRLIYDLADWKTYGEDFDTWIDEMGGLAGAKLEGDDRDQVRDAMSMYMNSSKSIGGASTTAASLVGKNHPLRKKENQNAPLMKAADEWDGISYTTPIEHNGRLWFANHYYQNWMSCPATLAGIAPRAYAMFAPQEFFAECYVEYYRAYDGTERTEKLKGGNLPAWIKKWFDANVDGIGRDPARVRR